MADGVLKKGVDSGALTMQMLDSRNGQQPASQAAPAQQAVPAQAPAQAPAAPAQAPAQAAAAAPAQNYAPAPVPAGEFEDDIPF